MGSSLELLLRGGRGTRGLSPWGEVVASGSPFSFSTQQPVSPRRLGRLPRTRLESLFIMREDSPKIRHKGAQRCKGHSLDLGCGQKPEDAGSAPSWTHISEARSAFTRPPSPGRASCIHCHLFLLQARLRSGWSCPPKAGAWPPPEQRQVEEQWPHRHCLSSPDAASGQFDGGPLKVPLLSRPEGVTQSSQTSCCPQRQVRAQPGAGAAGEAPPGSRAGTRGHGLSMSDPRSLCPGLDLGSCDPT